MLDFMLKLNNYYKKSLTSSSLIKYSKTGNLALLPTYMVKYTKERGKERRTYCFFLFYIR